jgi:predicted DsbA family dithiol-disulfide isomerase
LSLDRTLGSTDHSHELLAHATDQGRGNEIWTAMFRAHFGQARRLWTADEVLDFAAEAGLDREEAAGALRDRRYRAQVAADQREAERLGARGMPFMVTDGTYAIPGAVGTDALLEAMTRAWEAGHPEPRPLPVIGEAAPRTT